jgi:hypothetical protein
VGFTVALAGVVIVDYAPDELTRRFTHDMTAKIKRPRQFKATLRPQG